MLGMSAAEKTAAEQLTTPVQFLKGVGPNRAELLHRLGLYYAQDLLFFFPRDYEDLTDRRKVADLEEGRLVSVLGTVEEVDLRNTGTGRCVLGVLVRDGSGYLRGVWFNQPYLRERFAEGQRVMFSGKAKMEGLVWEMVHPRVVYLADDEEEPAAAILPVYPLTEGLQQWEIRRIVREVLDSHLGLLDEAFPPEFLEGHRLVPLRHALAEVHFPTSREGLDRARRRLVYQELLILQLALAVKRHEQHAGQRAPAMSGTDAGSSAAKIDARIRRLFPFELTASQEQAIAEIAADMARPVPMNRLLQGDVGSGKTIVAVYAMLLAVAHGYQAVLMAPTEVLARQHTLTLDRLLAASQVRRGQLTGGLATRERNDLLLKIAAGEIDILVGTHAVIQEDVVFRKLGLVVIDEQHKFGVRQRATLKQAAIDPHYLVMTATPIPRTVTMTLFGDLEVSTLRDAPAGPAEGQHLSGHRGPAGQMVGLFWPQAPRGAAGIRRRAAGRGVRHDPGRQPGVDLRIAGQRAAGAISPRPDPRTDDARGEGRRDGPLPLRRDPGAGLDHRGRGRRRRPQRHADDDRDRRAFRPGPVAPASRTDQPRVVSRLLRRVRRPADRGRRRAARRLRQDDRRLSSWRRSTSASAGRASCLAPGSTGCRRFGSPIWPATPRFSTRPGVTPKPWWPPTRAFPSPSTPGSAARSSAATARRCRWPTWGEGEMMNDE